MRNDFAPVGANQESDTPSKIVWVVEPYGHSIFILTEKTKTLFHAEPVASCGICVDFAQVFST